MPDDTMLMILHAASSILMGGFIGAILLRAAAWWVAKLPVNFWTAFLLQASAIVFSILITSIIRSTLGSYSSSVLFTAISTFSQLVALSVLTTVVLKIRPARAIAIALTAVGILVAIAILLFLLFTGTARVARR